MNPFSKRRSKEKDRSEAPESGFRARARGFFARAKLFLVYKPTMVDVTYQFADDNFMKDFIQHAMPAAAYDSSARDPPPRCHPGTRLLTVKRARTFIDASGRNRRVLWYVGPAGVGKSAVMQTTAETTSNLGASIFFSVNSNEKDRRDDPSKVFTTLAFQVAVNHPAYREHIRRRIAANPALPEKSMATQFEEFIIKPFVDHKVYRESTPLVILLDGLDECKGVDAQCEILEHITRFARMHPSAPLLWIIASRPEPHITSFFSRPDIVLIHEKEEITVDSNEGRESVERFLRTELNKIRTAYDSLSDLPQWPQEHEFLKLAAAAIGLFAYASTIIRFIGDPEYRNPVDQLQLVLELIDEIPFNPTSGETDPMARLDTLYERILSRIPQRSFPSTVKLLLVSGIIPSGSNDRPTLRFVWDWLGMTRQAAYAALDPLHSVLNIPPLAEAAARSIQVHHKSLQDYLSKRFPSARQEAKDLWFDCALRVLKDRFVEDPIQSWEPEDLEYHRLLSSKASIVITTSSDLIQSRLRSDDHDFLQCMKAINVVTVWVHDITDIFDNNSISPVLHEYGIFEETLIKKINFNVLRCFNNKARYKFSWLICCKSKDKIWTPHVPCSKHDFIGPVVKDRYFEWFKAGKFGCDSCYKQLQSVWMHTTKCFPDTSVKIFNRDVQWMTCSLQDPVIAAVE